MIYDEDLLVELIARGDVSQTEIGRRVGVSRRTVWRIANGQSRPDLQQRIADTVEGIRRATVRLATKWMEPLLKKQIKIALEGDDETARKCREFLLKTFMITLPEREAKTPAKKPAPAVAPRLEGAALYNSLFDLSPDLKQKVVKELGGPSGKSTSHDTGRDTGDDANECKKNQPHPKPSETPVPTNDPAKNQRNKNSKESKNDKEGQKSEKDKNGPDNKKTERDKEGKNRKEPCDPFANFVDGPYGKKVYAESIRLVEEAKAEAASIKPRRRVPRARRE